jgi:translation initiation factor 3 subunit B
VSYWTPGENNKPASVVLMEMPSRTVLREKHLYNVLHIKLHWHPQGTYMGVKIQRQKTKNSTINNFEIFRMRTKGIPVEVMETEDDIIAFAWEPQGHRFSIISAEGGTTRTQVSVYQLKSNKLKRVHLFDDRPCNHLYYSPNGRYLIIAGLDALNGSLEFMDVQSGISMNKAEHFMCTDVEWSPCGRYVITAVTQPLGSDGAFSRYTMDNGYKVWNFQGELLVTQALEFAYQVLWRPRPASLLTKEDLTALKAKMKSEYWPRFLKQDSEIKNEQLGGKAKERLKWKDDWKAYRATVEVEYARDKPFRRDLRNGVDSDDENDWLVQEMEVEEELDQITEIL